MQTRSKTQAIRETTSSPRSEVSPRCNPRPRRYPTLHVLVVEDVPENQMVLTRFLEPIGGRIELADNGREGVDRALTEHFDIILMDIQMPIMDGYQATRLLRDAGYTGPIIAVTAYGLMGERENCLRQGFDDYVTKPLDRNHLLRTVEHWAGGREAQ